MSEKARILKLHGVPSPKQKEFFDARCRFIAYGGARGGGKSWALRRKLVLLALNYSGIRALLVRRTLPELKQNHLFPLLSELGDFVDYKESQKTFYFPNGSKIVLGYCDSERDVLRYQGQEYDIIALDEATQLTEYQFSTFKACLRGANDFPKRMYLTCNPGGVGHSWVKRLFIDKRYTSFEKEGDYKFISAKVFDNKVLLEKDKEYVELLSSLPDSLKKAWLFGDWDVFEGQFFPEFSRSTHVIDEKSFKSIESRIQKRFIALDYGFDMLAVLWFAVTDVGVFVYRELAIPNLTLSAAASAVVSNLNGEVIDYACASPDLWNRRQDSGLSGVLTMSRVDGMPVLIKADDRRIAGWRCVREFLDPKNCRLFILDDCHGLIKCLESLLYDKNRPEDASSQPHDITHLPEALRYGLMSYQASADNKSDGNLQSRFFTPRNDRVKWSELARF